MTEEWEEAKEKPPTVHEDDTVPPKRSLSPRTHQALREVVTCILGQVARKHRGQRDDRMDLQDKLKCELAVLQWHRSGKGAGGSQQLREAGPQPAPPARQEKRRAGPAQPRMCTEEEGRKLWDSLRKKCQQKARAKVAAPKAWKEEREQWEAQGSCIRGTPEWWGEGRKEPPVEDEESPEDKLSLCLSEPSPLKRSLSPRTERALRGAATRLLEMVEGRAHCHGGEEESLSPRGVESGRLGLHCRDHGPALSRQKQIPPHVS
ncbi:uncharacterized protein LJ206_019661 isoform 2-T2 [Theristicus caerulescens]